MDMVNKYGISRTLVYSILLSFLFINPSMAHAESVLDQSFTGGSGILLLNVIGASAEKVGQTFVAGKSGLLAGVNVDVRSNLPPYISTLKIEIFLVQNGLPTNEVLGTFLFQLGESAPLSLLIEFPEKIPIQKGMQYAIVASYTDHYGTGLGFGTWRGRTGDGYNGGGAVTHRADSWEANDDRDLYFRTYATVDAFDISLSFAGSGSGVVIFTPPNTNCTSNCAESYDYGTIVTLSASPDLGSIFSGWFGACSGVETCQLSMNEAKSVTANFQVDQSGSDIIGKVYSGYQGWFNSEGDLSPIDLYSSSNKWRHWSKDNTIPSENNIHFDLYPDVSEYHDTSLFATNLSNLANSSFAKLYSSHSFDVINKHFKWMYDHELDGIALQRFGSELYCDPLWEHCWHKETRDNIASYVKQYAEIYKKHFYIMYDISGMNEVPESFIDLIKNDWQNAIVNDLGLINSQQYAKHYGKPVVCIWGIGFQDKPGNIEEFVSLITWFKNHGCYVVGGVPSDWRTGDRGETKPGFESVYNMLDMISPWTVGRYTSIEEADIYKENYLSGDKEYCDLNGIDYQPVLFPGFSWSNWYIEEGQTEPTSPSNLIPRDKGKFFWRQAYNIAMSGIESAYIAMFDEYDESTAIAKAAEDSSMIPEDLYFLTLSADGTYISSDYYLRLAGLLTKMIKKEIPTTPELALPFSIGPIFFRSGFEIGYDATPTWIDTVDDLSGSINVTGYQGNVSPECGLVEEGVSHQGKTALRYSGQDVSDVTSYHYFKIIDVDIPVYPDTKISYWIFPEQNLGRFVGVDLIMTDGSTLRDSGAVDYAGNNMHPAAGRGTVATWTQIQSDIGRWLEGKTIDKIIVGYDKSDLVGDFRGYIDDILIETSEVSSSEMKNVINLLRIISGEKVECMQCYSEDVDISGVLGIQEAIYLLHKSLTN